MESSYRGRSKATGWIGNFASGFRGGRAARVRAGLAALACAALLACGGTWTGSVGAVFGKDNQSGRVYVREAPSDMPAARAGLMVDDEIVAVDGHPVRPMSAEQVHEVMAGKVGTKVRLEVRRSGETREIVVERGPLKGGDGKTNETKPGSL